MMRKYSTKKILKQALSLTIAAQFLFCQNPFATREPEPPISRQSSWIQPTSTNFVLINLANAIAEKNIINYARCLADTSNSPRPFRYIAEPSVARANPGLFDNWGNAEEINYLNQMMSFLPKDSTSILELKSLRESAFQDSVIFLQEYTLTMNFKCEDEACPRKVRGQAEFRLIRSPENLWSIYLWSDYATGSDPTWSELRAYFGK